MASSEDSVTCNCPVCASDPASADFSTAPGQRPCTTDGCPVATWDDTVPVDSPLIRDVAREAFIKGVTHNKSVENVRPITIRTAITNFQRWWDRNPVGQIRNKGAERVE